MTTAEVLTIGEREALESWSVAVYDRSLPDRKAVWSLLRLADSLEAEIERLTKEREKHLRAMRLQHDEKERMRAVVDAARGFSDVPLPDEFAALRAALAALDRQD